jgi:photosystem II stability/assembly factor-like uncharacterized protein
MKITFTKLFYLLIILAGVTACQQKAQPIYEEGEEGVSGAGLALDAWALARSYPGYAIPSDRYALAYETRKMEKSLRGGNDEADWSSIGPKNIGGRTLCLAFHPDDPDIIYAGSASGGLWKTETAGKGVVGWTRVDIDFPVLGVAAIGIDPVNPDVMYIGTGEVYNYQNTGTGYADRVTRGTYGIGILKTTDGGVTWSKSLDWAYEEMRAVQDLYINPMNPNTLYAATTEGLYRSRDAGENWENIHDLPMAVQIEPHPTDTSLLYITHGSYDPTGNASVGVFRSQDAGDNWAKLTDGIPGYYSGKTLLSIAPGNPDVLYASVANAFESIGLFKTTDGGDSWQQVNSEDVAKYQGWYSHDVAVDPNDENTLMYVGIDLFRSNSGGAFLEQRSYWFNWFFGQVPVGGPEGPDDYVHADIHRVYYHPALSNTLFMATDGGIFVSEDNGETFEGRNGSYQTQQFYANFANAQIDSLIAMGGMQDNSTAIYTGDDAWTRVIGGDGMSASIHPTNPDIMFGSYQRLNIARSTDGGASFSFATPDLQAGELTSFNGPYELVPSAPETLYAGGEYLYKSEDLGDNWFPTTSSPLDPGNPILTIAIAADDPDFIYVSTAPLSSPAKVLRSKNGGISWATMEGLPDRLATDIAFDPVDKLVAYATFAGFGTAHVYKTEDGGDSWFPLENGIPDVPANSVVVDPEDSLKVYVGNDLGVYVSTDGGDVWEPFDNGLPGACLVMHLSISQSNRKLRAATHGNGVWETPLIEEPFVSVEETERKAGHLALKAYPNPLVDRLTIEMELKKSQDLSIFIFDNNGRRIRNLFQGSGSAGVQQWTFSLGDLPKGSYFLSVNEGLATKIIIKK